MTAIQIPGARASAAQARLDRMAAQLETLVAEAEERRRQREAWAELAEDLAPVSRTMLTSLTERMGALDERGYAEFARGGAGVVDRVVTSFGPADVQALGDNIVLILSTLRDMTQPEVLALLRRTAASVGASATEPTPSLPALLRRLSQPEVRRGLARLLTAVAGLGDPSPDPIDPRTEEAPR